MVKIFIPETDSCRTRVAYVLKLILQKNLIELRRKSSELLLSQKIQYGHQNQVAVQNKKVILEIHFSTN